MPLKAAKIALQGTQQGGVLLPPYPAVKTPKNAFGAVNRWMFVSVSRRPARVAHLWVEALGDGWLRPVCGRFPGDYFDERNLDRATGEFRKCRDCIQHEVQRG